MIVSMFVIPQRTWETCGDACSDRFLLILMYPRASTVPLEANTSARIYSIWKMGLSVLYKDTSKIHEKQNSKFTLVQKNFLKSFHNTPFPWCFETPWPGWVRKCQNYWTIENLSFSFSSKFISFPSLLFSGHYNVTGRHGTRTMIDEYTIWLTNHFHMGGFLQAVHGNTV